MTATRPEHRRTLAAVLITAATALSLGGTLKMPSQLEANDLSRWCTVWSLVERGTYAIDDCPWQSHTQDKVRKPDKLVRPTPGAGPLRRFEYSIAPRAWKVGEPAERFYSSKPPLLPTLVAGLIYPVRRLTGVPIERVVDQAREPRWVERDGKFTLETPAEPAKWPAYVFYFKPVTVLLNVAPYLLMLVCYARWLDRHADGDWPWVVGLFGAAFGTYLLVFNQTLNNHTVAAYSAFFALYAAQGVWSGESRSSWRLAAAGFSAAFCACNELPAALFGLLLLAGLLVRFPGPTLRAFVPAAAVPCLAFLATQYLAFGQFRPVYEEFGTKSYEYAGSYWTTPLELDWLNRRPEPVGVYLFHMTLGHHGVFSLTPLVLFALVGAGREVVRRGRLAAVGGLTLTLTAAMLAFYAVNPKARNYGGSTQGLRWLFWLIPFWLLVLPRGLPSGEGRRARALRVLSLAALAASVLSVGYGFRSPWTHPWVLDALEHLGLYPLRR